MQDTSSKVCTIAAQEGEPELDAIDVRMPDGEVHPLARLFDMSNNAWFVVNQARHCLLNHKQLAPYCPREDCRLATAKEIGALKNAGVLPKGSGALLLASAQALRAGLRKRGVPSAVTDCITVERQNPRVWPGLRVEFAISGMPWMHLDTAWGFMWDMLFSLVGTLADFC